MFVDQNHLDDLGYRIGECSVCGKRDIKVRPVLWNFPHIECQCHNEAGHTKRKMFCKDCKPICPRSSTVHFDIYVLTAINMLIENHEDEYHELVRAHKEIFEKETV